jgi:putative nucleotidyltransferase with HDIG domain
MPVFGRFRLTFLMKFALVTFVSFVVVASALATFLNVRHMSAVEDNEGTNAAGEISALLTMPLEQMGRDARPTPGILAALRSVDDQAKRQQFVDGIRIYNAFGRPIYPPDAAVEPDDVRRTLQISTIWSKNSGAASYGDAIRTEYVPFVGTKQIFVVAIDLSKTAIDRQASSEAADVFIATAVAIGLVFVSLVALAAGASREIERRRREAERTFSETLGVLAETIDQRDPYTAGHSRRVAEYSKLLAAALRMPPREIDVIGHAALLHDVGKIGIPDAVLFKESSLDPAERGIISEHPVIGARIIRGVSSMEDVVPCVLHHHEHIDGSGYPDHLRKDEIPSGSRVIAVADTFDAMTTDRPYRHALSVDAACRELLRVAGTQLDAAYVAAFLTIVASGAIVPPPSQFAQAHEGDAAPRLVPAEAR